MIDKERRWRTGPDLLPEDDDYLDWEDEDYLPHISNVASACECTGLMPRPPLNAAEEEAYRALYSGELPDEEPFYEDPQ